MSPRIPYAEARARSLANPAARPKARTAGGGECWPRLSPSFRFGRDARLFALGSCFATNIEAYLIEAGFDMRSAPVAHGFTFPPGILNKYAPPTIRQEIEWARRIRDRDDRMRPGDAEAVFCALDGDRVIDTQLHVFDPVPRAAAIERRGQVYRIWREIFEADVVVVTLGLIETWWDDRLGLCLQNAPTAAMARETGRYFFERLDYPACLDHARAALALLDREDGGPNVLLTTSPVVMSRTFTAEDVAVANMQSKAILRAVCGAIAAERTNVDYFPSYESAMLSDPDAVWEDDLVHVRPAFVARIMARVRQAYVAEEADLDPAGVDAAQRLVALSEAGNTDAALAALAATPDPDAARTPTWHLHAALTLVRAGRPDEAAPHLAPDRLGELPTKQQVVVRILVHRLRRTGRDDLARMLDAPLARLAPLSANLRRRLAERHLADGDDDAARAVLAEVEPAAIATDSQRTAYLRLLDRVGDAVTARRLLDDAVARDPASAPWQAALADHLDAAGEPAGALRHALAAAVASDHLRPHVRRAARLLRLAGRDDEALALVEAMMARHGASEEDRALHTRLALRVRPAASGAEGGRDG